MKYTTKKRFKLWFSIIIIPCVIFLISFFVHNLMVYPYVKSQTDILSRHFKDEIYERIKWKKLYDDKGNVLFELSDEQIAVMWEITDTHEIINIPVAPLMNYIRVFYIISCILCSIVSLICMKWYMSNGKNLFISDNPEED